MGLNFESIQAKILDARDKQFAYLKDAQNNPKMIDMDKLLHGAVSGNYDITSYFIINHFLIGNFDISYTKDKESSSLKKIDVWEYIIDLIGQEASLLSDLLNISSVGDAVKVVKGLADLKKKKSKGSGKDETPEVDEAKDITQKEPTVISGRKPFKDIPANPVYCSPLFVQSVDISNMTTNKLREWDGNQWVYTTGRPELATITITLRDFSGGILYRLFHDWMIRSTTLYPIQQYCTLSIARLDLNNLIRSGTAPEIRQEEKGKFVRFNPILYTNKAVLVDITPPSFTSNEELATFRLTFDYDPFNPII